MSEADRAKLLTILEHGDIGQPHGGYIEDLIDCGLLPSDAAVLERYLLSEEIDNRECAINALGIHLEDSRYLADAVNLFFDAQHENGVAEFVAIGAISTMAIRESAAACRMLLLLSRRPRFAADYGLRVAAYMYDANVTRERLELLNRIFINRIADNEQDLKDILLDLLTNTESAQTSSVQERSLTEQLLYRGNRIGEGNPNPLLRLPLDS